MFTSGRLAIVGITGMLLSLTTGCATILGGGGHQPVVISSSPLGSQVEVINHKGTIVHSGITPFTVDLERSSGFFTPAHYTVRVTDAASPREAKLNGSLNPWYLGNIVFGGLIGIVIVDPLTGAMWHLPNEFNVDGASAHAAARAVNSPVLASDGPEHARSGANP